MQKPIILNVLILTALMLSLTINVQPSDGMVSAESRSEEYIFRRSWGGEGDQMRNPRDVAIGPDGRIFVLSGDHVVSPDVGATTFELAGDPDNVGLYWLFQPTAMDPEQVEFTASMPLYGDDVQMVDVYQDEINRQDFPLGTGNLVFDPTSFEVTMVMGDAPVQRTLNISNDGTADAEFILFEVDLGHSPVMMELGTQRRSAPDNVSILLSEAGPFSSKPTGQPDTAFPNADVELILDDGTVEDNVGIGGTWEFIFLNRFTPDPSDYPFTLNEIQVYFEGGTTFVSAGDEIILVVYENTTGNTNPAIGSNYLASFPASVQTVDAWNTYTLPGGVFLGGPGDVLIGVIALETPGSAYFPAAIDQTFSHQRSWAGWWLNTPPPAQPTLPPDDSWMLIDAYFPGNWMIRGMGSLGGGDSEQLILDPSFEAYTPNPFWDEFSALFGTPLCTVADCGTGTGTGPNTGLVWSWFGGSAGDTGYVSQDVVIDPGIATLTFYVEQYVCGDAGASNYMRLQIDGTEIWRTDGTDPACGVLGYRQITLDVSDFADGISHEIKFEGVTVGNGNFFIDDVELHLGPDTYSGLIFNGSFEDNPSLIGWTYGGELPVVRSTHAAHGNYSLQLGKPVSQAEQGQGDAWAHQTFYVRPEWDQPTLSFRYNMFVNDILDYSDFFVVIQDGVGLNHLETVLSDGFQPCLPNMPPVAGTDLGWRTVTHNLSDYKGEHIRLVFSNRNLWPISWGIWTYVDDVRVIDAGPSPSLDDPFHTHLPLLYYHYCDPVPNRGRDADFEVLSRPEIP